MNILAYLVHKFYGIFVVNFQVYDHRGFDFRRPLSQSGSMLHTFLQLSRSYRAIIWANS